MLGEIKLPPPATAVETVKNVKSRMAVCLSVCLSVFLSVCLLAHMSQHLTSSVSADGPRDAQYRSKSRQLLRNECRNEWYNKSATIRSNGEEHYARPTCSKQCGRAVVTRCQVVGVVNQLDRRRVLLTWMIRKGGGAF